MAMAGGLDVAGGARAFGSTASSAAARSMQAAGESRRTSASALWPQCGQRRAFGAGAGDACGDGCGASITWRRRSSTRWAGWSRPKARMR